MSDLMRQSIAEDYAEELRTIPADNHKARYWLARWRECRESLHEAGSQLAAAQAENARWQERYDAQAETLREFEMNASCGASWEQRMAEFRAMRARAEQAEKESHSWKCATERLDRLMRDFAAERDAARAEAAAMREALRVQDPRNSSERYDKIADEFYAETGMWAPGRSIPPAFGGVWWDEAERDKKWREHCNRWHERHFDAALSSTAIETIETIAAPDAVPHSAERARLWNEAVEACAKEASAYEGDLDIAGWIADRIRALKR